MRTFVCTVLFFAIPAIADTALGYYRLIATNDHLIHSVLDTERQRGERDRIIRLTELLVRSNALLRNASDVLRQSPMVGEEATLKMLRLLERESDGLVTELR